MATPPSNWCAQLLAVGSLALVVVAALLARFLQIEQLPAPANASVQYLQWQYNDDNPHHMTEWLAGQDKPVVLFNTPFDRWSSAQWSPSSLSRKVPHVLSKRGSERVFKYFATDQPLSTVPEFAEEKTYQEFVFSGEIFFEIFFELLKQPFDGYYYYASGGIELLELKDAIYTDELLDMLTFSSHSHAGMGLGQVNFWFGMENVTAYPHYDTSYNLHMMVHGQKKFLIYPPSTFSTQLHPCLHQFYRQLHADTLCTADPQHLAMEVTLNPGEVIFLPPYWFHKVVTLTPSVSLNVWSHSEAFLTMERVFTSAIPFEDHWGRATLMKTLNYFLKEWIEVVFFEDPSQFVRENVFSRYEPLLKRLDEAQVRKATTTARTYCQQSTESIGDILSAEAVSGIREKFASVLKLFSDIHSQSVRKINFANYIEHVTWRILGTKDILLLPFFLQECF